MRFFFFFCLRVELLVWKHFFAFIEVEFVCLQQQQQALGRSELEFWIPRLELAYMCVRSFFCALVVFIVL